MYKHDEKNMCPYLGRLFTNLVKDMNVYFSSIFSIKYLKSAGFLYNGNGYQL